MSFPNVPDQVLDIIRRAHWQSAASTEDVAPHSYVVRGWDRDEITEHEFDLVARTIKQLGRLEEWTPPPLWLARWGGRPMRGRYLYPGDGFAYWLTRRGSAAMLNKEAVAVQEASPTRRVVEQDARLFP